MQMRSACMIRVSKFTRVEVNAKSLHGFSLLQWLNPLMVVIMLQEFINFDVLNAGVH